MSGSTDGRECRVLHLIDSGGLYGAERVILNLSAGLRGSRFVPVVGCLVGDPAVEPELVAASRGQGIEAHAITLRNARFVGDLIKLTKWIRANGISLVHTHGYRPGVAAGLLQALAGIRAIATCHLWFLTESSPLKARAAIAVEKRLYRRFPIVAPVSREIRSVLVGAGVSPSRIRVVPNGVPVGPARTSAERTAARHALGLKDDEFLAIGVGRLAPQKAHHVLIGAAARIAAEGRALRVMILGEGPLRGELARQIDTLGLARSVELRGFVQDIALVLTAADAIVFCSLSEGMPMALLEAAARGVPIVTTPVGDVGEIVVDGASGLIIPPGSEAACAAAITALRASPDDAQRLAIGARERVLGGYSLDAMCRAYEGLYTERLGFTA
jgi:glycosyltransferase involved in cell wall biosynthesis